MYLALRRSSADRSPTDEIGEVLGRNHVEEFGARGNSHLREIHEQVAREPQAVVDFVRTIQVRIVNQPLPPNGGTRLLEIDSHDEQQLVRELRNCLFQLLSVFSRGLRIVNGTGTDDDQQPGILTAKDVGNLLTSSEDGIGSVLCERQLFLEKHRRKDNLCPLNP